MEVSPERLFASPREMKSRERVDMKLLSDF